jgi:hypothetical protein
MINSNKFTPKIRYISTQPPTEVGGGEHISPSREFFSYSDTDYEYLLYRTREKDAATLETRSDHVDRYHREESSEDNNFNLGNEDDYQTLFDDDNLLFDFPDEIDAFLNPGFFFTEITSFFNVSIFNRFFSDDSHSQLGLYYFLSWYFYFSEYVWPSVHLYFPFLDYLTLTFTFGWDAFLEHNLFACFLVLYFPVFVYFFLYYRYNTNRRFVGYFNFFRLMIVFFTVFFFCLFFPVYGLPFVFFFPALALASFFVFFFPYSDSPLQYDNSRDFYATYTQFLLPLPVAKKEVKFLPLYRYNYPYFSDSNASNLPAKSRFTQFPFLRISQISLHNKRIKSVLSYHHTRQSSLRGGLPHNFPHLQVSNFSGFLFEHFPHGFGYSAESHIMLEGFEKDPTINIEYDMESGLRPDVYTLDFMTNELGVSNVRFFLSESYHLPVGYSVGFDGSADSMVAFSPSTFSQIPRHVFGPYYELSIWLALIKPSGNNGLFSSSFESSSLIPATLIASDFSFKNFGVANKFASKLDANSMPHDFIKGFYRVILDFFYFVLQYSFLRTFGLYYYRFSPSRPVVDVCSDFFYIFSNSYPRAGFFKEIFKFMIFIDKNHKLKNFRFETTPILVNMLVQLYRQTVRFEVTYSRGFFKFFFPRRFKYVRLCRIKLERIIKNFF